MKSLFFFSYPRQIFLHKLYVVFFIPLLLVTLYANDATNSACASIAVIHIHLCCVTLVSPLFSFPECSLDVFPKNKWDVNYRCKLAAFAMYLVKMLAVLWEGTLWYIMKDRVLCNCSEKKPNFLQWIGALYL